MMAGTANSRATEIFIRNGWALAALDATSSAFHIYLQT